MEIIDESEVKKSVKPVNKKPNKKSDKKIDKKLNKKPEKLPGSPKDIHIEIHCERTKKGMTNNCSLCQHTNNDIFIICETKFTD